MLMSTLENFGGATSCRSHEHFNTRFSRWHWRAHLVQRSVEVKDGAQRVYVLPHDFAGLSNLQTKASFRDFPVACSDRNSAATYFHFTFKRAFSKKLTQSQNAEHQDEQHTKSKQTRARMIRAKRPTICCAAQQTCGPPSAVAHTRPCLQAPPAHPPAIADAQFEQWTQGTPRNPSCRCRCRK